jgi:putative phage-type endonuclease
MSIASGTCITLADREEWLATRKNSIGGSEAAAAIGVNPYETALNLYLRKLGLTDPIEETEAMRWGTRLEPAIAEAYQERTGYGFIAEQLFVRSPTHDFMTSTIDRVRDDSRVVEFKCVGYRSAHLWGEPGSDEIPLHYMVQCHHQLICTGTEELDLAALIGGNELRIYHICRDDDVAARIVEREQEFWDRVQRRDPPPIDPARDGSALARLWPRAEGEVELGPVGELLVEQWEAHGRAIREHEAAKDRAKTELLTMMAEAASARLANGRILRRKVISIPEREVKQRAYAYTDLRILRGDSR